MHNMRVNTYKSVGITKCQIAFLHEFCGDGYLMYTRLLVDPCSCTT